VLPRPLLALARRPLLGGGKERRGSGGGREGGGAMAGGGGGGPGPGMVKAGSRPPWVGLAAAVWVQVAAGSAYVFPLYSHAVKEALGYDQKALTMLGVGNDVGENVGLVPGVLANRLPPWLILVIGSACAFFGFGTLWLAVTKTVAMPYWVVRSHPLTFFSFPPPSQRSNT